MATLADIRTDVRSHLDEATARQWTDTELNRWINEAARDIARRSESLQVTEDVTAVVDQQEYTLPTDVIRLYRVEWRPDAGGGIYTMEYRDFNSMDSVWWSQQATGSGYPVWFTLWGYPPSLKLTVYPKPSQAGTFKVFYYGLPADAAADGTTVAVPEGWQDLIALYAEYVALRKDADPRWQEAKGLYEERLGALLDVTRRWTDQADAVQVNQNFVPNWLYSDW